MEEKRNVGAFLHDVCWVWMHTQQDNINYTFYLERQPISDNHAKESLKTAESLCKTPSWKVYRVKYAMKVCGLDYKGLGWGRTSSICSSPCNVWLGLCQLLFSQVPGVQIHLGYLNLNSVRIGTINSKWHATSIDDIKKTLHLDPVKTADEEKEQ